MQKLKLHDIRLVIMFVNFIAVFFVVVSIAWTTERICSNYEAREFLDTIHALPKHPMTNVYIVVLLYALLIAAFVVRERLYANQPSKIYVTLILDFAISAAIVGVMNFNYNGIFFLVFTEVIYYVKGNKGKYLMICLALISFLLTDQKLLSISYNLYSINDYFNYYDASVQQYLIGAYNLLGSLNIILFIIYCSLMIQQQRGTIEEVNMLYEELRRTNADLQNANGQLAEYAKITEHMGETKERNRLAREIHDTLGHTLTGISVGIDACIATVEVSPKEAKAHLERISEVARNGLLDIRRSVNELKPDSLERLNLETAILKMITDMKSVTDMEIYFDCKIRKLKFDEDEESAIYRVIQESVTNALRHGKASLVRITMEKEENMVLLTIKDNGIGCAEIKSGFGTKHIMERIGMLNGTVEFRSENGFSVIARIPIRWGEEYD
ncbi:MAG: sensor histidine kinase [Lachnospiraceae bacterium]|nr:sensor histidine kinase [Lachnospiraceae bacterium]